MRTYKQQRREFVLLAMKLIEKRYETEIDVLIFKESVRFSENNDYFASIYCDDIFEDNEDQIQKLKDLLKESR